MVSFAFLEVGKCYCCGDAEYFVMYKTANFAVVMHYSYNHLVGALEFWNDKEPMDGLEEVKEWPLTEYIDDFVVVDNGTVKNTA